VASAPADYVPAEQAVHPSVAVVALSAKLAYSPAEHAIALHDEELVEEYVPAVHTEHDVASAPAD